MTATFDPGAGRVAVRVFITGPRTTVPLLFALDTGAAVTVVRPSVLAVAGLVPDPAARRRRLRSLTGGGSAPMVVARQLLALGCARPDFPVAAHDLPPAVTVDGLLGLDFLRERVLTLDFARGRAGLRAPRRWWPWG